MKAIRINGQTPIIDGDVNDPAWGSCNGTCARDFTQRQPNDGKPATESTTVAVMYDDNALYLAFWCYDSQPDKIIRELVRRDRYSESDYVEAAIDPFHDHQTGNEFVVSASGSLQDSRLFNDESSDMTWDGVWEGKSRIQPWGYSVEMRIPYHCLRFTPAENQTWGINFFRYIGRLKEESRWSHSPMSQAGFTSRMGHINGIQGIKPTRHFEVMPYGVSSMESQPKSTFNKDGKTFSGNTGVDLKYGISSDLVFDATINPDFGQVELDEPVLNLSTYETFYEEKRPFFQEGANLFNTDYDLFYSRRIGRPPRYSLQDPNYAYHDDNYGFEVDRPNATSIFGAARLTGKIAKRTTIAVLSAMTSQEKAEYAKLTNWVPITDSFGDTVDWAAEDTTYQKGVVEPLANYSIFRLKQDILKNSYMGGMLTVASQENIHPAVTGGFDWRLVSNDRNWIFRGQTVFSDVDTGKTGYGFSALLQRKAGKHFMGQISTMINSPDLKLNRLGYLNRTDMKEVDAWVQYRTVEPWKFIRNSQHNLNFWSQWNYNGDNIQFGGNYNNYIEFTNNWYVNMTFNVQGEKYSDIETRGNGLWIWPKYPTYSYHMCSNTDSRKKLSFHLGGAIGTDRGGDWWSTHSNITLKPKSNLEFVASSSFNKYNNSTRWVDNKSDGISIRPVFATLNYDQLSFGLSGSILFHRNLSLQLSAEGLMSGLDYAQYRYYYLSNNSYSPVTDPENWNEDYNYSALNTMALLRWEYMPGSTLYFVWTRGIDIFNPTLNNLDFTRDMKGLFGEGSTNVFLIKLSYWMNI
jgi:hypothetical protein